MALDRSIMKYIALSNDVIKELVKATRYARRTHHRIMLVLTSNNDGNLVLGAIEALSTYINTVRKDHVKIVYLYHAFFEDGCARKEMFKDRFKTDYDIDYVSYHESIRVLGQTFNAAILDLMNNLEPNDIGKLSGIVEGGGIYILLLPSFETLYKIVTRFQNTLLTPQYGHEHLRRFFERRFVSKLYEHNEFFVGWYHSHPGLGFFYSDTDILNHIGYQDGNPLAIGLVFDHTQFLSLIHI